MDAGGFLFAIIGLAILTVGILILFQLQKQQPQQVQQSEIIHPIYYSHMPIRPLVY
jgi:hypothetical protein